MDNYSAYYTMLCDIINNFEIKNRNYQILQNINDIEDFNKNLINDINIIINQNNMYSKFSKIMTIYDKMKNRDCKENEINIQMEIEKKQIKLQKEIEEKEKEKEEIIDCTEIIISY